MRKILIALSAVLCLTTVRGSNELDKSYALRNFAAVVINTDQDPVFCEHVENEIIRYLRSRPRFEFNDDVYVAFKEEVRDIYLRDAKVSTQDKIEWIRPQLQALKDKGVDTAVVAEVFHFPGQYRITLVMVSTNDLEYIAHKDLVVEDYTSMDGFTQTVIRGLDDLEKRIPFDGSVIRRDGFKVVLDRGFPDLRQGEELVTYTVEKRGEEEVVLEETGVIRISEVGDNISFGTIVVERKPKEVTTLNKILLNVGDPSRELAFARESYGGPAKELGEIGLSLGASLVTATNAGLSGAVSEGSKLYPGGSLRGEMWLTNKTFVGFNFDFNMSSLSNPSGQVQGSNINDLRILVGHQFGLGRGEVWKPVFRIRAGFARHSFQVDNSADAFSFNSMNYSGILAGGGVSFRITDKWGTGFDVHTLLFAGASESPTTSGSEMTSVNGWDFALFAIYHFNEDMDILTRLAFNSYAAEFAGVGTRPVAMTSATQSGQSFTVGVSYFF